MKSSVSTYRENLAFTSVRGDANLRQQHFSAHTRTKMDASQLSQQEIASLNLKPAHEDTNPARRPRKKRSRIEVASPKTETPIDACGFDFPEADELLQLDSDIYRYSTQAVEAMAAHCSHQIWAGRCFPNPVGKRGNILFWRDVLDNLDDHCEALRANGKNCEGAFNRILNFKKGKEVFEDQDLILRITKVGEDVQFHLACLEIATAALASLNSIGPRLQVAGAIMSKVPRPGTDEIDWSLFMVMEKGLQSLFDFGRKTKTSSDKTCAAIARELYMLSGKLARLGFVHMDGKINNIVIMPNHSLRFIDFDAFFCYPVNGKPKLAFLVNIILLCAHVRTFYCHEEAAAKILKILQPRVLELVAEAVNNNFDGAELLLSARLPSYTTFQKLKKIPDRTIPNEARLKQQFTTIIYEYFLEKATVRQPDGQMVRRNGKEKLPEKATHWLHWKCGDSGWGIKEGGVPLLLQVARFCFFFDTPIPDVFEFLKY